MSVDLWKLEAFFWTATLRSQQRAAKALHRAPSAISFQIKTLEETELATKLFEGTAGKPQRLTAAGQRLLPEAQRLLEEWSRIKRMVCEKGAAADVLRLGAIESVLHTWLVPWIDRFKQARPGLKLELMVDTTDALVEALRLGQLDLALASRPTGAEHVITRDLPAMPMSFVGSSKLHRARSYTLAQLAQYDLLTFQRASQPQQMLDKLLHDAKLTSARVHTISSISAMTQLVAMGFGIATLPRSVADGASFPPTLRLLSTKVALEPLPMYASYRTDCGPAELEAIVEEAVAFAHERQSGAARRRARK